MKELSGTQLIRQGAFTAVGTLLVYGVVLGAMKFAQSRRPQSTDCGCGCGGSK